MKSILFFLICLVVFRSSDSVGSKGDHMHEVRTYMSYTWPVDPAKIITLPDMDLSYALTSTLVEWGPSKQIVAGAASKWEPVGKDTLRLTLRDGLKWSNGQRVTSGEVKACLERGMLTHPQDWQSLHNIISKICGVHVISSALVKRVEDLG
jgi:ABC-type transport system substrate-binding protein